MGVGLGFIGCSVLGPKHNRLNGVPYLQTYYLGTWTLWGSFEFASSRHRGKDFMKAQRRLRRVYGFRAVGLRCLIRGFMKAPRRLCEI